MERRFDQLVLLLTRASAFAGASGTLATLLLAVSSACYSVWNAPVPAGVPPLQPAIARCDALGDQAEQQRCEALLVAQARRREAGAAP